MFASCPSRVCNFKQMTVMNLSMKLVALGISRNFDWTVIRECGRRRVLRDVSQGIENSVFVYIRKQVFDVSLVTGTTYKN
jgi:hypothetical protein